MLCTIDLADLDALCSAVCDGFWLKKLLYDFEIIIGNIQFCEGNEGCLALIKNPLNNKKVKHIGLKFHFVGESLNNGLFSVKYVLKDFSKGGC